jgi:phenylpropionate dioxygenase-like ring-hydroxylating dioxygenase large terminal subunit
MSTTAARTTTLANYWHPIAHSDDVTEQPTRFELLGEKICAFRTDAGVSAFKDLCIHRGTALSLGWVTDGRITCAYHGWQYDAAGKCVKIPSLPEGSTIPRKARAIAYRAEERYGLVWVAMDEPIAPIPAFPHDDGTIPASTASSPRPTSGTRQRDDPSRTSWTYRTSHSCTRACSARATTR